ncbi:GNAT family N-acetyltransferase [Agromyces aureus]|uniref:GNAT family N-acetyltransferase n=1 Tax=Agromyces aureus TaxID=453304 RepID=UPI000AE24F8E|nr:GNAT family N-acetyltransferase [Agromyces aureus]
MTIGRGRQAYSDEYAAAHGRFSVIPAGYIFLLEGSRVLLQLRSGTGYYDGWWGASAAGHVDAGESVVRGTLREAAEEIGVSVDPADLVPLTTMHRTGPTSATVEQRVDFFFACRSWAGEPRLLETTASDLRWFELDDLPENVVHHERFVLEGVAAGDLAPITAFGFAPGSGRDAASDAVARAVDRADAADEGISYGTATRDDIGGLIAFWQVAGENDGRPVDTPDAVARQLERDPDALIVARAEGRIVGTVIAGYDGWRAHLYRLAVLPSHRRRGIARELMRRAEARLAAFGVSRIDAMVLEHNELGQSLWSSLGYTQQSDWRRWVRGV